MDSTLPNPEAEPHRRTKRSFGPPTAVRFLTFSCLDRLPLFHRVVTRTAFAEALHQATQAQRLTLHAWVVMPEHVHLLVAPGPAEPLERAVQRLKSTFARDTLRDWQVHRPQAIPPLTRANGRRHFWQPGGGHNRVMRHASDCLEKQRYIHHNPVKRGLVDRPADYRWSSAWRDVEQH